MADKFFKNAGFAYPCLIYAALIFPAFATASGKDLCNFKVPLFRYSDVKRVQHNDKDTPLPAAVSARNIEAFTCLIKAKTPLSQKGARGDTALHRAALGAELQIIRGLIAGGAVVNDKNDFGETPLKLVADQMQERQLEAIKLLLAAKANPALADKSGLTALNVPLALALAGYNDQWVIAKLLIEHGADLGLYRMNGWSPVMVAISNGKEDIFKFLVEHDTDLNYFDPNTQLTALDLANGKLSGSSDKKDLYLRMVDLLKKKGAKTSSEIFPDGKKPALKRSPPVDLIDPSQIGKVVLVRPKHHPAGYGKLWPKLDSIHSDKSYVRLKPETKVKILEQRQINSSLFFRVQALTPQQEAGWLVLHDLLCTNVLCEESDKQRIYPFKH